MLKISLKCKKSQTQLAKTATNIRIQTRMHIFRMNAYHPNPPSSFGTLRGALAGSGPPNSSAAAAAVLLPHADAGAGAVEMKSSQPPAAEEAAGMDQPEAGRGGTGGGLDAAAAQRSEVEEEPASCQPDAELDGAPQHKSELVAEVEGAV